LVLIPCSTIAARDFVAPCVAESRRGTPEVTAVFVTVTTALPFVAPVGRVTTMLARLELVTEIQIHHGLERRFALL
jgi:hypothetical protein